MTTKETNKTEKTKIYSPQTLIAINSYLPTGALIDIALNINMSYSHVRMVMTGNKGFCLCRNVKSQKIVEEALKLLKLRQTELISKREAAISLMKNAKQEATEIGKKIDHINKLIECAGEELKEENGELKMGNC